MFSVCSLFSEICRDSKCSMTSVLSDDCAERFCSAVDQILNTSDLSFPRQIVFKGSDQLYMFFNNSLQGFGSCVYIHSQDKFNLLPNSAKVLGKSAFYNPQSEMSGACLAVKMQQKISLELYNVNLASLVSSEILKLSS